ncbi:hypothetical protein BDZ89DRAFT_1056302 [Hymenopellis radicata]|nr:hypothetical protein BDZ89DRAFT_1056302 [Hymenopellis radicata]
MSKRQKKPQKHLKQTTLLESLSSPSRPSPSKPPKKKKDPEAPAASRKRRKRSPQPIADESDSDVGAIKFVDQTVDSDAENKASQPSPKKRRKIAVLGSDEEESDAGPVFKRLKKKEEEPAAASSSKGKARAKPQDLDSDEEDVAPRKTKSRLHKGSRKKPAVQDDSDSDELEQEHVIEARFRSRDKKTAFQRNLEKLKRKKLGKPVESSEDEDGDYYYVSVSEDDRPFKGARKDGSEDDEEEKDSLFDEGSDKSSDFIIEDDGDGAALLPVEFRAQQDLAHHFKTIFQFFVHVAVQTPHERSAFMEKQMKDEYFSVPLQVARRKIIGLRDSLVASSVWRPEFKKSLEALPRFNLYALDFSVPACDACHLGGRVSTLRGQLGGAPYNILGFDEIVSDPDSDESDDSDSEKNKKNKKKLKKKKAKKVKNESAPKYIDSVHLGRFCAKRTRVYHDLSHWEYHLFKRIEGEVDELHSADKEDGYPPEDLGDADGICEWLDERQFIEQEWQALRKMMESATQLEVSARKGEDVD